MESRFEPSLTSRVWRHLRFTQVLTVISVVLAMFVASISGQAMDGAGGDIYCEPPTEGSPATCYEIVEVTAPQESINAPSVPGGSDGGEVVSEGSCEGGGGIGRARQADPEVRLNLFKRQLDRMTEGELIQKDRETRDEALAEYEQTGQWGQASRENQAVVDELRSRGCTYSLDGAVNRVWSCSVS